MARYQPPEWSALPSASYAFEMVKDGVVAATIDVSAKPFFILGRHASTADLVLEHPSVSRQHAVLQHRSSGEVYLMDLGSTHGTFLNKRRLQPHMYVPLRLGSSVKLGTSSRLLVLMGEAEPTFDPTAAEATPVEAPAEQLAARAEKIAKRTGKSLIRAEDLHGQGAGWGFAADAYELKEAEDDPLEELPFEALYEQAKAKGLNMTARQTRLVEQLEKRVEKLDNLSSENDRIAAKEIEGLSEGQRGQMERNEARIKELQEQVASLKETIADSIREQLGTKRVVESKASGKGVVRQKAGGDASSDEDDFFDRTAKKSKTQKTEAQPAPAADSEASLRAKLAAILSEREELCAKERELLEEAARQEAEEAADPLEAYMSANSSQMRQGRLAELRGRLESLAADEKKLRRLLEMVRPAMAPSGGPTSGGAGSGGAAGGVAASGGGGGGRHARGASSGMGAALEAMRQAAASGKLVEGAGGEAAEAAGAEAEAEAEAKEASSKAEEGASGGRAAGGGAARAADAFKAEYLAALSRMQRGEGAEAVAGEGGAASAESGEAAKAAGLGFGAAPPDASQVQKAKQALREQQAAAGREAAMAPGLNRGGARGASIGPAMPPSGAMAPPPARVPRKRVEEVPMASDAAFDWQPPADQRGDGKTALNEKLGY